MSNHDKKAVLSFEGQEVEFDTTQILFIGDALIAFNEQNTNKNPMYFHRLFSPIMEIGSAMQEYKPPVVEPLVALYAYPIHAVWSEHAKHFFMPGTGYRRNVVIGKEVHETRPFKPDVSIDLTLVLFPVGPVLDINSCRLTGIITAGDLGEQHWDVSNLPRASFVKSIVGHHEGSMNLHFDHPGYPSVFGNLNRRDMEMRVKGHVEGEAQVIGLEFAFDYLTSYGPVPSN